MRKAYTLYGAPGQDGDILQAAIVVESVIGERLMPAIIQCPPGR